MTKNLNNIILLLGVIVIILEFASVNADSKKCQKRNGNFPKAGSSCKEYYQCKHWIPVEKRCPEGKNFNANRGWCDWEELYPCLESVIVFTLEFASVNADSKKCQKRNGNFPKAGSSCKEYYQCKNWIPVDKRCPKGDNFNANTGKCDWEELYPCLEKQKSKECLRENGRFLKPGTNCKIYYDCCNGKPTEKKCPYDTFFDPSIEKCEWSELYTCIEKPKRKECHRNNGRFLKPGTNCKKYYDCKNGVPTEKQCQKDTLFNPSAEECEWPEIYTCVEKPERKECPRRNGRFLKPRTNCKKYYDCSNGEPQEKQCRKNELFNPSTEQCESQELYTCIEKPERKECPRRNGLFLKPGTNCKKYYNCSNGEPEEEKCEKNTHFNPLTEKCESSDIYTCIESQSTTEKGKSTVIFTSSTPSDDQNRKTTILETSPPTSTNKQSTAGLSTTENVKSTVIFTYSTPSDDQNQKTTILKTDPPTSTNKPSTPGIRHSTVDPESERTISKDLETSTSVFIESTFTETQSRFPFTSRITPSTVPTSSIPSTTNHDLERTNSDDLETSTKMIPDSTPVKSKSTPGITTKNTSPLTTSSHLSSTKEVKEVPLTESTVQETTSSTTSSIPTKETEIPKSETVTNYIISTKRITTRDTTIREKVTFTPEIVEVTTFIEQNIMCPEPFGHFPHPTDEHKFVACVDNVPSIFDCPSNLVYNEKRKRCDYKF